MSTNSRDNDKGDDGMTRKRSRLEEGASSDNNKAHDEEEQEKGDTATGNASQKKIQERNKKRKSKANKPDIPLTAHYHRSWMHASEITAVAHSSKHGYVVTGDTQGVVFLVAAAAAAAGEASWFELSS